ncbi:hypothetical protein D3C79_376880 [compost metagenome]
MYIFHWNRVFLGFDKPIFHHNGSIGFGKNIPFEIDITFCIEVYIDQPSQFDIFDRVEAFDIGQIE